ncbi:MAG: DUF1499 domain-containing protein [Balneolaceae bacterium]|nr:DUF1499 domain-containing protein [Balneolaceae bacterium]
MNTNNANPLPPCPKSPNCCRLTESFKADESALLHAFTSVFDEEAHCWKQADSHRIELHSVYRIPLFGWKDDVDVILEAKEEEQTIAYIRSASRLGFFDLWVNTRRLKRIIKKVKKILQGS